MGKLKEPSEVKLIIGMIANNLSLFQKAEELLEKKWGEIDYKSPILNFTYTDYYTEEMGSDLKRKFISFRRLIKPGEIVKVKLYTNKLEKKYSHAHKRNINIDPGYLNEGKVILASTKDNLQRIYLRKGIYAEVTLFYKNKSYEHFLWTYPDYCSREYKEIFQKIRDIFREQLGRKK